ncbi:MAG: 50S ribosomal protein L4 [Thermoleophilia bacterium]
MADNEDKKIEDSAEAPEADATDAVAVTADAEVEAEVQATDIADAEVKTEAAKPKAQDKPKAPAKKKAAETGEAQPAKKAAPKKAAKTKKKVVAKTPVKVPAVNAIAMKDANLHPDVFEIAPKIGVMHEVVRAEMAALRQGNASTKRRGEVSGGGIKPWRQKGTGRARAGSSRMPHWTGGGVTFGPKPRDYSFKVNRKVRTKALKMALSARVREGNFKIVDALDFDEPKTQAAAAVLAKLEVGFPLLVLIDDVDANAIMAFRNLPRVSIEPAINVDVSDILGAHTVLATSAVVEQLNNKLGGAR